MNSYVPIFDCNFAAPTIFWPRPDIYGYTILCMWNLFAQMRHSRTVQWMYGNTNCNGRAFLLRIPKFLTILNMFTMVYIFIHSFIFRLFALYLMTSCRLTVSVIVLQYRLTIKIFTSIQGQWSNVICVIFVLSFANNNSSIVHLSIDTRIFSPLRLPLGYWRKYYHQCTVSQSHELY